MILILLFLLLSCVPAHTLPAAITIFRILILKYVLDVWVHGDNGIGKIYHDISTTRNNTQHKSIYGNAVVIDSGTYCKRFEKPRNILFKSRMCSFHKFSAITWLGCKFWNIVCIFLRNSIKLNWFFPSIKSRLTIFLWFRIGFSNGKLKKRILCDDLIKLYKSTKSLLLL